MIPMFRDDRVAVYDHFLPEGDRQGVLEYFDRARFRSPMPDAWGKAFRLNGGNPLVGAETASHKRTPSDTSLVYPTQSPLDRVIERLMSCSDQISEVIGAWGTSWNYFTMCPYIYPSGTGLGWHTDAHAAGAFIYYAHLEWGIHWGGQLLVQYSESDCSASLGRGILRNERSEDSVSGGMGYYFSAVPNRMIFLRGRTTHMITRVDPSAGENLRLSLSGFFLRADDPTGGTAPAPPQ